MVFQYKIHIRGLVCYPLSCQKPLKIKYYCEKRDPDFESKMHDVLVVYKQVSMQFDENGKIIIPTDEPMVHTISCDEKPGIQAIATTGSDLRPMKENGCVMRDAEYKRLGTLSLLARIDLLTGKSIPIVSETHKSSDFINLLKKLNEKYPEGDISVVEAQEAGVKSNDDCFS